MSAESRQSLKQEGAEALRLMEAALALLDQCEAHALAAQLDLAICRLRDAIASEKSEDLD